MGKMLLVSLAMEGKFSTEGPQGIEDDDDVLTAIASELVNAKGSRGVGVCRLEGRSGTAHPTLASFFGPQGRDRTGLFWFTPERVGCFRWRGLDLRDAA
jgi:hypothetical protein